MTQRVSILLPHESSKMRGIVQKVDRSSFAEDIPSLTFDHDHEGDNPLRAMTPQRGEIGSQRFHELFPDDACVRILAELSVWTGVDDCLAAARFIEGRPASTDTPSRVLIIPFPDNDEFQVILMQCLDWLVRSYATPPLKADLDIVEKWRTPSPHCDEI